MKRPEGVTRWQTENELRDVARTHCANKQLDEDGKHSASCRGCSSIAGLVAAFERGARHHVDYSMQPCAEHPDQVIEPMCPQCLAVPVTFKCGCHIDKDGSLWHSPYCERGYSGVSDPTS